MTRLHFRATAQTDAEAFLKVVQANVEHLSPWVTTPTKVFDASSACVHVAPRLSDFTAARFGAFDGPSIVASARIIELDSKYHYEIGIWCSENWTKRGVSRWLLCNVIEYLFSKDAVLVVLRHDLSNLASGRLLAGVGASVRNIELTHFKNDSQMAVYMVTREEWPTDKCVGRCEPWLEC